MHALGESVGDHPGQHLGRRVHARERGLVVEVAVGQLGQRRRAAPRPPGRCRRRCRRRRGPRAGRWRRRRRSRRAAAAPGPNTSPRRLWAIIMWSRTVTLNTVYSPVVGDGVAERRQAARRPAGPSRRAARRNRDCPVSSASKAGSRSSSSASASRSAVVRRCRGGRGRRVPTWLARMPSRPEWNAPPSDSRTSASPYQLRSMTVPSGASSSSDRCSPADVALAWTTRSRPPAASAGSAKSTPSASATSARLASTSTSVTRVAGKRAQQARHAAADHAGADDGDPVAEQRRRVPQGVDRGLDRAREDGASRRARPRARRSPRSPARRRRSGGGRGRRPCGRAAPPGPCSHRRRR